MPDTVLLGADPPVALLVRHSTRARRISLRVSQLDGRVTLTVPRGVSEREAIAFARSREAWIRDHLAELSEPVVVAIGTVLPVEGVPRVVAAGQGRAVKLTADRIEVPEGGRAGPRLAGFLKQMARDRLAAASDLFSTRLGKPYKRLTMRDTRSRWGSCSSAGNLNYAWRLILAPEDVLQYVAAHEVAHLAHMNHGPAFWSAVETIHGPYDDQRRWLRETGGSLHRYRFEGSRSS